MNKLLTILWLAASLSLSSCAHNPRTASTMPTSGNLKRLMGHSDADIAREKAPVFTRDALETVNALETELKEQRVAK